MRVTVKMLRYIWLVVLVRSHAKPWKAAPEDSTLDGRLRQVHIFYRHAHSEPEYVFPDDPNKNASVWKHGPGELSILGRHQAYQFGSMLRKRYSVLLPESLAWKTVRATSSNLTTAMMTSAAVLAGLIPPGSDDTWDTLNWQPAAVYPDEFLQPHLDCPVYLARLQTMNNLNAKAPLTSNSEDIYDFVTRKCGVPVKDPVAMRRLYSCLESQRQVGLILPPWVAKVRDYGMRSLVAMSYWINKEDARLRVGPLLRRLFDFDNSNVQQTVHLYCTHDVVIGTLLSALAMNVTEPPNFLSTFVIEFRERAGHIHTQLWYRNGVNEELKWLMILECGIRCPINKFRSIIEQLAPEDWGAECGKIVRGTYKLENAKISLKSNSNYSVFFLCLPLVLLLTCLFIVICGRRTRQVLARFCRAHKAGKL